MQISDVIADMLTRIRNANTAGHATVDIPASKMKKSIAGILKEEGFITSYEEKVAKKLDVEVAVLREKGERLNKKLEQGDIVEILTSKNQTPRSSWLDRIITPHARQKLLHRLNNHHHQRLISSMGLN